MINKEQMDKLTSVPLTMPAFMKAFYDQHNRPATEQEIWDAGLKAGMVSLTLDLANTPKDIG